MIPHGVGLRVVGDVHGDLRGFTAALATDRFVIQLGDLVDNGPDSAGVLRAAFAMRAARRGVFLLGNHDWKLLRALRGRTVHEDTTLAQTLAQLGHDAALRAAAAQCIAAAPAWLVSGNRLFVHGGFHTHMLVQPPPTLPVVRVEGLLARALYGQPTGRTQPDGYPERSIGWVARIPSGITVYCGHDWRGRDGRPLHVPNEQGGAAWFVDTGAGKGGHLSWIDLPPLIEKDSP